jgi:hypothetical protein
MDTNPELFLRELLRFLLMDESLEQIGKVHCQGISKVAGEECKAGKPTSWL